MSKTQRRTSNFGKGRPLVKRSRKGTDYYNYSPEEVEEFSKTQKRLKKKALERFNKS